MCGIFGFSGKAGERVNLHKLMVLGLFNESRGKDACGYYYNGFIDKGVFTNANFHKFISENKLISGSLECSVFMGHTRKATCGQYTYEGAHPHIINDDYVQTHNGVIKNVWPLCTKYNIEHKNMFVDSIGLAQLIAKIGPKTVLEEYVGSAALAFTFKSNPRALYLYHGSSKERKDGELVLERPLYILYQPEGIYYSSMFEALDAINLEPNSSEYKCGSLMPNFVFEIVDGKFTGKKLAINRINNNIVEPTPSSRYVYQQYPNQSNNYQQEKYKLSDAVVNQLDRLKSKQNNHDDIIVNEQLNYDEKMIGSVMYFRGRYYRIQRHTPRNGPEGLAHTLLDGSYIINSDGLIIDDEENSTKVPSSKENRYFFISGILIKCKSEYIRLKDKGIMGASQDTFKQLSRSSKYPIIQIYQVHKVGDTLWYHRGHLVKTYSFTPKWSKNHYRIDNGRTKQIY